MRAMIARAGAVSFIVSLALLLVLVSRFGARFALDRPNERSLHERPVPRTGGIAVLCGACAALLWESNPQGAAAWLPMTLAAALAAVSFLDDLFGMPAAARLAAHAAAALALCWQLLGPAHLAQLLVLVLALAWITNLFNFMDGSDGLAGGMALIGFATYAFAARLAGNEALAFQCAAIAAACAAFLLLNFHPARIFLGDVGSIPLGFLAGGLGLAGWRDSDWPLWFPVLVFGPFIGDATITLVKRLAKRERVWQAHREHYYQRMVRMGLGHRGTAWAGYALMLACSAAALLGREQPAAQQAVVFIVASTALAAVACWVDIKWARHARAARTPAAAKHDE
jgi:phospho-N-acetylmuramoyl-pentapeptide-transferase